jgi:PEP-CTERM motif
VCAITGTNTMKASQASKASRHTLFLSTFSTLILVTLALLPQTAQAQYTFTNIASTGMSAMGGGTFTGFGVIRGNPSFEGPSISGNNVAFNAAYSGGTGNEGIFLYNGSLISTSTVATNAPNGAPNGGTFDGLTRYSLSGNNIVFQSLTRGIPGSPAGIFLYNGTSLSTIVTTFNNIPNSSQKQFYDFGFGVFSTGYNEGPNISGNNIIFYGDYVNITSGTSNTGIFSHNGTSLITVGTNEVNSGPLGTTFNGYSMPSISGNNIAFAGGGGTLGGGIFLYDGITLNRVVTTGMTVPTLGAISVSAPSLSGSNIAFLGTGTGSNNSGVFLYKDGSLSTIATTTPNGGPGGITFWHLNQSGGAGSLPSISGNTVAFLSQYDDGTQFDLKKGIFMQEGGGVLNKVVGTGDTLFGSTITNLIFSNNGLDGSTVAFQYTLANGQIGVATASAPVAAPEPGTLILFGLGGSLVLLRQKRG